MRDALVMQLTPILRGAHIAPKDSAEKLADVLMPLFDDAAPRQSRGLGYDFQVEDLLLSVLRWRTECGRLRLRLRQIKRERNLA